VSFHLLSVAAGIEPRSVKSACDGQSWLSDAFPGRCPCSSCADWIGGGHVAL
jgi:hypothetical protein